MEKSDKMVQNKNRGKEERKMDRIKNSLLEYRKLVFYGLCGVFIGCIVGVLDAGFGEVLLAISSFRDGHIRWLLPFLAPAGILIVWLYKRFGANAGKGMGLIFQVGHGEEEQIPLRLIPFVIGSTWLTHLVGGSAGREGVAVQIGATFSSWFGRKLCDKKAKNIFLIAGMAAGFAGLFGTPLAAVFFALEVLVVGVLQYEAFVMAIFAAFSASMVAGRLGLEKFTQPLGIAVSWNGKLFFVLCILGVCFGLVGMCFSSLLAFAKKTFGALIENPMKRIAIGGVSLTVLLFLFHMGRYCGLGTNLIGAAFYGEQIYAYDWILKLGFTIVTLAVGFQGGEVTPLFSIGASLGVFIAPFFGIPSVFGAALGYAAVFGSATNILLAPIFIGAEVFGYEYLPYFFLVCGVAYVVNGNGSIYSLQKIFEKSRWDKELHKS